MTLSRIHRILILAFSIFLYSTDVFALDSEKLFIAAKNGDSETISMVIKSGVDVDTLNKNNASALWVSVNWNKIDSVRTLLKLGANPNLMAYGASPLYRATGRDTAIVKELIQNGADTNLVTTKGNRSPLGSAAQNRGKTFKSLKERGRYTGPCPNIRETVKLLIEAGADVNHVNNYLESPLRSAVRVNNYDVAKVLLKAGADVHQKIDDSTSRGVQSGNTILMVAIYWAGYHYNLDIIELLLQYGANPNDANTLNYDNSCKTHGSCPWRGYSALTYATNQGYKEVVQLLLKNGANIELPRNDGKSALDIAIENNDQQIIDVLKSYMKNNRK